MNAKLLEKAEYQRKSDAAHIRGLKQRLLKNAKLVHADYELLIKRLELCIDNPTVAGVDIFAPAYANDLPVEMIRLREKVDNYRSYAFVDKLIDNKKESD